MLNFLGYFVGYMIVVGFIVRVFLFLFFGDKVLFKILVKECFEFCFEGGVYFCIDNEVGLEVGD